jgi:hypothetical protein
VVKSKHPNNESHNREGDEVLVGTQSGRTDCDSIIPVGSGAIGSGAVGAGAVGAGAGEAVEMADGVYPLQSRQLAKVAHLVEVDIPIPQAAEVRVLADEFAMLYRKLVQDFCLKNKVEAARADEELQKRLIAMVEDLSGDKLGIQSMPPEQIDWYRLMALAEHDTEAMLRCWRAINELALDQLYSGLRAADVVVMEGEMPLVKARFLALRLSFISEWQPRGGLELTLIDVLAQSHTQYEYWMRKVVQAAAVQAEHQKSIYSSRLRNEPPRISDAEAVAAVTAMAERFNRTFLRTLRQLRDLRRYAPTIMVQHASQINVGAQQINLTEEHDSGNG